MHIPVFLLLLALFVPVHAEENETPPTRPGFLGGLFQERQEQREVRVEKRDEMRENFTEHREEVKEHIAERRAHFASTTALMKANLSERAKEFVLKRAEDVASLLDAMIDRLNKLAERIQARIDVLKSRGVDTSEAEASLADANIEIDEAEVAVEDLKEAVAQALGSEEPREELKEVKPLAETTKTAIREAHTALVDVITSLPNAQNGGEGTNDDSESN